MRTLKLFLIFFFLYATAGDYEKDVYLSSVSKENPPDTRIEKLREFLRGYNSPLEVHSEVFISAADDNNLDWKLLPAVSCAESSCGKHYIRNAFGWGSDRLDFGEDEADIRGVAEKIATLRYYEDYRRSGQLQDFALAYNGPYAETYLGKVKYFYDRL